MGGRRRRQRARRGGRGWRVGAVEHGGADSHGDTERGEAVGEDEGELAGDIGEVEGEAEGGGVGDGDAGGLGRGKEPVEGVDDADEVGLEGAGDVKNLHVAEDAQSSVPGGKEEAQLPQVDVPRRCRLIGEGDAGDIEFQAVSPGESEVIEGDDGPRVRLHLHLPDLRPRRPHQRRHDGQRQRQRQRR